MPLFMPDAHSSCLAGPVLGFYGQTGVTRPSGYTAAYTAASRAMPGYTAQAQASPYTGGLLDLLQAARLSDLNALRASVENGRTLSEATAARLNQLIADLAALGLISGQ